MQEIAPDAQARARVARTNRQAPEEVEALSRRSQEIAGQIKAARGRTGTPLPDPRSLEQVAERGLTEKSRPGGLSSPRVRR
jgi:hypothetical protein